MRSYRLEWHGPNLEEISAEIRERAFSEALPIDPRHHGHSHDWIAREIYEERLRAIGDSYLGELLDTTGDDSMGLLSELLEGLGSKVIEAGETALDNIKSAPGEIAEQAVGGFAGAIADVRNKLVMEPFFGRSDMTTERLGEAVQSMGEGLGETMGQRIDAAADRITDGLGESNKGLLAELMEHYGPSMDTGRGMEIDQQKQQELER